MRISYDPDADAAYIYLVEEIGAGAVARTIPVDSSEIDGMINLDFDAESHLLGIEILDASRYLPESLLGDRE
jgi:uncharacterized protein YuzE